MGYWQDGMYGLIVGDALGVPVEFSERAELKWHPVTDMREYGAHYQPKGTWSDDSSMALATLSSIIRKEEIDYKDVMDQFIGWYVDGKYSPFNDVFDIGGTTSRALVRYAGGEKPLNCGGADSTDNGNGSLMRILPACLYLYEKKKTVCISDDEIVETIHNMSSLTHAHIRSRMACGIYYFCVEATLDGEGNVIDRLQNVIDKAFAYYMTDLNNVTELQHYEYLRDLDALKVTDESKIRGNGYVVNTLIASIWCLITTDSYKECVLKAVNLGEDTDTTGAVAGGLAGLLYGFNDIPEDWLDVLQNRKLIDDLIDKAEQGVSQKL